MKNIKILISLKINQKRYWGYATNKWGSQIIKLKRAEVEKLLKSSAAISFLFN